MIIIYQLLPRLFGNNNPTCIPNGTIEQNGCGKMNDITPAALRAIRQLGATHVWYTGLIEHATQTDYSAFGIRPDHPAIVKGRAGSPYAIKDYYDIDPDLATSVPRRMDEFEQLVERTHRAGLKVIIDFVPNHVARQYHSDAKPQGTPDLGANDNVQAAFSPDNNFYYIPGQELRGQFDMRGDAPEPYREYPAKATGNDRFDAMPNINDWYETVKLNYGIDYAHGGQRRFVPTPDTWEKMRDILRFWASKGIDGFRCDMAEMVPVEFWQWVIPQIKHEHPELLFIAEVYNPAQYRDYIYRGQFDYLYDKVGLYDTLRGVACGYRPATDITRCWQSLGELQPQMLNFLENHDEQRIASDYFAGNPAKAVPAFVVSACMNTNPVMLYFGQEFGEHGMDSEGYSGRDGRTTIFDYWSLDVIRRWRNNGRYNTRLLFPAEKKLYNFYQTLLTLCNAEPALSRGQFFDLMYVNPGSLHFNPARQYAFLRKADRDLLLIVANFDGQPTDCRVLIPAHAFDYLGLPPQPAAEATDLLTRRQFTLALAPEQPVSVPIDGYSARILKFNF